MAADKFTKGSRKRARQSITLVTDGKSSVSFMTNKMVEQLDDKASCATELAYPRTQ